MVRIGFAEFCRFGPPAAFSGSVRDREIRARTRGFRDRLEPVGFSPTPTVVHLVADHYMTTCSAQIDSLRSSLIAVADYRDGPAAEDRGICFARGEKLRVPASLFRSDA
jgi:hypothetical protein